MLSVTKLLQGRSENIVLILGKEDNASCFYYLQVNSPVRKYILSQLPAGKLIDITSFGTVLERGYGEPNEFHQIKMRERYDFIPEAT